MSKFYFFFFLIRRDSYQIPSQGERTGAYLPVPFFVRLQLWIPLSSHHETPCMPIPAEACLASLLAQQAGRYMPDFMTQLSVHDSVPLSRLPLTWSKSSYRKPAELRLHRAVLVSHASATPAKPTPILRLLLEFNFNAIT